jgi:hypothetical protein
MFQIAVFFKWVWESKLCPCRKIVNIKLLWEMKGNGFLVDNEYFVSCLEFYDF